MGSIRPEVSPAEKSKALMEMQLRLSRGESEEEVRQFLLSRGLQPYEARRALEGVLAEHRRAARKKGLVWLGFSLLSFLGAAPFAASAWAGLTADASSRAMNRAIGMTGQLPIFLVVTGLALGVRGLALLFSRSYSPDPD